MRRYTKKEKLIETPEELAEKDELWNKAMEHMLEVGRIRHEMRIKEEKENEDNKTDS